MKIGLQLATEFKETNGETWSDIRSQAEVAEESGFDGVFIPTEIGWRRADPLSILAAVASVTQHMRIGTNIVTLPLYAPLQVAEAIATADFISGGRAILGIASGWRQREFAAAGVPFEERIGRTSESTTLIRRLWTESQVSFSGRFYNLDEVSLHMKPLQKPHPPIWVGAHAQAAIERAARSGLTWIEGPRTSADKWQLKRQAYMDAAVGADTLEFPLMREAFAATSNERARSNTERALLAKYREYAQQADMSLEASQVSFDRLSPRRFLVGSVEYCREQVLAYAAAGATWLILRFQYMDTDRKKALESIRLFGREVRPVLD